MDSRLTPCWKPASITFDSTHLPDALGEIDLAIKKERRPASHSFIDAHPDRLVALLLKGGSRYISLHGVTELDENFEFGGKTVYTFAPPERT